MDEKILKYKDFDNQDKWNSLYLKEHNKFLKKYNDINLIFLNDVNLPFIYLYEIVDILFKNNSIFFKRDSSDIVLLTITAISLVLEEDSSSIKILIGDLEKKKILRYLKYVKFTIKSIKNIFNIVLKENGEQILNFEQAIRNKESIRIFYLILNYIKGNTISIKDFYNWFITGNRTKDSNRMIDNISNQF